MATHSCAIDTSASPEALWRLWSQPSTWPDWNPDVESISLDGPFASGATGRMRTKRGGEHPIRLEEVADGRSFQLETAALPGTRFHFRCEIAPRGGGSRISQAISMSGPLGGLFSAMMGAKIAQSFEPILKGLAAKAEASRG
jgi:hypothetical protein